MAMNLGTALAYTQKVTKLDDKQKKKLAQLNDTLQAYKAASLNKGKSSGGGGTDAFGGGGSSGGGSRGGGGFRGETEATVSQPTDSYDSYYDYDYGYGGGGSGVSGPQRIDLTDILASYEQGAAAQTKAIEDSRESQRQSLLTSLKRFQDETAEARNQQRRAYNASRADLEGQAFMANRQAAQNAAARGLGGSGLQQLAQLQNLINQSAATDKLAQSNTDVLKQLAAAAQNKEEDTNTAIQNLSKEAENKLAAIAANNAQARAELQYKEDVRYEQARQAAEEFAAQLAAQNAATSAAYANEARLSELMSNNALGSEISNAQAAFKSASNKDELKAAYNNALGRINSIAGETTLTPQAIAAYRQALDDDYNSRYKKLTSSQKKAQQEAYNNIWQYFNPFEDVNKINKNINTIAGR